MNIQDKERIIKAFDDALTYEENHRPWKDGEDYFNTHYGQEPVYTKKVISLFGKDNCTLKIRQGEKVNGLHSNAGLIPIFDENDNFTGYEFKNADGKHIGTLSVKDGWRPAPAEQTPEVEKLGQDLIQA